MLFCEQTRYHVMTSQPVLLLQSVLDIVFAAGPVFPRLALGFIQEGLRACTLALQQQGGKPLPVHSASRASGWRA